jgi:hypothetical protein
MSTVEYRFEVGYDALEAVDNVSTWASACKLAEQAHKDDPLEIVYIFDRMARTGKANLWHLIDGDFRVAGVKQS